ncbi:hypothetical protein E3P94_01891 [Wallemia ichthyophaga]|nr:hypothetical protein E3P95_01859 [Wallemia ichthyophaga]TIB01245.1 hypothetical protein E3P94_01891 [Wallemia ichthyophaga]
MSSANQVQLAIHPLPVLNISDHCTRSKWIGSAEVSIGALLGVQSGRNVQIVNSFELRVAGGVELDNEYLNTRLELFKQVFPEFELIGWYTQRTIANTTQIHKQLLKYTESPLLLVVDTQSTNIHAYVSVFDVDDIKLVESDYSIQTTDIERVTVDDIHKSNHSSHSSALKNGLNTQVNAIKLLDERVDVIRGYLTKLVLGQTRRDDEILGMIYNISTQLPATTSAQFERELDTEANDTQLTSLLAALTSSTHSLNNLINKHSITTTSSQSPQSLQDQINSGIKKGLFQHPSQQPIKSRIPKKGAGRRT